MGDFVRRFVPMWQRRLVDPSVWTPAIIPGCILYGGAYQEARAVRAVQPTLYTAAADYTPSNAAIVLTDDSDVPAGLSGTSIKATCSDAATRYFSRAANIVTGNRYDAAVWIKSDGTAEIKVQDGTVLSIFAGPAVTAAWALYAGSDTAQDGSLLVARRNAAASGTYYFRPVSLVNRSLQSYTPAFTTIPGSVLAQATPTAQPWVSSDGLGIRYQGGDALVWSADKSNLKCLHDGNGGTFFVAFRPVVLNDVNYFACTSNTSAVGPGMLLRCSNANTMGIAIANVGVFEINANFAATIAINTTYVAAARIASGANGISLWLDGVKIGQDTSGVFSAADPLQKLTLGANAAGSGVALNGIVGHPAVYNRALTDTEIVQVSAYIKAQATL